MGSRHSLSGLEERVTTRTCLFNGNDQFLYDEQHVLRGARYGTHIVPGVSFCTHVFVKGFGRPPLRARVKEARLLCFVSVDKGAEQMINLISKKLNASVCIVFFVISSVAQGGIEPMSGVGGVMREGEARAFSVVKPEGKGKPVTDASMPKDKASSKSNVVSTEDAKILGVIEKIKFYGSVDFAEKFNLAEMILSNLGPGEKTIGEVKSALRTVRQNFIKEGYYLFRIQPIRKRYYDAKTKTFSVWVDQGRFGKTKISFDGNDEGTWFSKKQINRKFKNLSEGEAFNYNILRTALFDANSHPDLVIDTFIDVRAPIEGKGDYEHTTRIADIDLKVHEDIPFHMLWEVNNYGMDEIEEWQTTLTAQYLNLLKYDDVFTISPSMSLGGEMVSVAGSYMLPHYYWLGGNTTFYAGYSDLDVSDIVPRLSLEGSGYFFGIQHSENLYDTERHLLAASVGLIWRNIEDQYTAMGFSLQDRSTSIMPMSAALSYTGKKPDSLGGRNFATIQGVFNFMTSGDSLGDLWTGAEENYWVTRWQLARLQPLLGIYDDATDKDLHQWMLFLKLEGQYTTQTLIPVEKLSLGGYNCMRGYRTRGYLGDFGTYGTVELRTPILVDPISALFSDRDNKKPIDRLQLLAFVDYGWTAFNDLPSGYDDNMFIYSAGIGARFSVTKYFQVKCDIAFPLRDTDWADDESVEIYLSVAAQF